MKLILSITNLFLIFTIALLAQIKPNVNQKPYPYKNPVIHHMYTADAAPHVMPDGKVWMVTSVDHQKGGGYETMRCYHTFSSNNMVDWKDEGEVLNIKDVYQGEQKNVKVALWAPDMIYRNHKYFLYYPVRILHTDTVRADGGRVVSTYIGVAVSDSPSKKFHVVNSHIEGTKGIDPAVFIDDDGTPYLYWGSHMAAQLKDNMIELQNVPVKLDVGTDRFMEAIWMDKLNDKYLLSYHTKYDWKLELNSQNIFDPNRKKSELAYSVGNSPLGPFKYVGTFNLEPGEGVKDGPKYPKENFVPWRLTLSNHGGIVEYHGQRYLFYHTSALSSWRQDSFKERGTWTQRSVCIDSLNLDKQNHYKIVNQTLTSVDPVTISQPYSINLLSKDIVINNNARREFKKVNLGTGYYFISVNTKNATTGTLKVLLNNKLIGTLIFNKEGSLNNNYQTSLRGARGIGNLVLEYASEENKPLTIKDVEFIAGSAQNEK